MPRREQEMTAEIHQIEAFRDKRRVFPDRFDSGEILGRMLRADYGHAEDGIVLAIPSGGVPVGIKVKEALGLPFDLLIVRKFQIPGNTEAGFGAMTLDGTSFFNQSLLAKLRLSRSQIDEEKKRVSLELKKRNDRFRKGRPFPDLSGKLVILVDDGLASGFTMLASVNMARKAEARETVVAVPTAPQRSVDLIAAEVDHLYCANIRTGPFFAVADAYRNWYDLGEEEVIELMGDQ